MPGNRQGDPLDGQGISAVTPENIETDSKGQGGQRAIDQAPL